MSYIIILTDKQEAQGFLLSNLSMGEFLINLQLYQIGYTLSMLGTLTEVVPKKVLGTFYNFPLTENRKDQVVLSRVVQYAV